jgi:RNA polymerase sigma-70 factor, ECF subfamily
MAVPATPASIPGRSSAHLPLPSTTPCTSGANPHEVAAVLVQRAQAGDASAFGELVRRYRDRIFALVLHLTGNESDADDITQEVFWGAFRAVKQFAGRSEFFTWVYRIAVNKALNARRNRTRRGETPLDDPRIAKAIAADAWGDPARAAELRQTYALLLEALDSLPPEMKTTVVLVALQGLGHSEAAVIQECSPGTIAWRMHKARERLHRAALVAAARRRRPTPTGVRSLRAGQPPPPPPHRLSPELDLLLQEWGLPAGVIL